MTDIDRRPTAPAANGRKAMEPVLLRRLVAEALGTGLLVAIVVGSGIQAQRLSVDVGVRLLENSLATGAGLAALILAFGPVSGAHFNPVVTLADRFFGGLSTRDTWGYIAAQVSGGCLGTIVANLMFGLDAVTLSTHARSSGSLWLAEAVATFGLVLVILGVVRTGRSLLAPFAVGGYIAAAYWFTSSTSFANPAVTIARALSDSFAGIRPSSVPAFVIAQVVGAALAVALGRFLHPQVDAAAVIVPHEQPSNLADRERSDRERSDRERSDRERSDRESWRMSSPSHSSVEPKARVPRVLFLCVHNAGRSQMALGWFNYLAGDRAMALSGGSEPASQVNPAAIAAMAEIGIDIGSEHPKIWTNEMAEAADVVITMGCGDSCPVLPGKRYEDWALDDPAGMSTQAVRPIRDEIGSRVRSLLESLGVPFR